MLLSIPEAVGVTDEHVAYCEDEFLRRLVRETGEYLAEPNGIPAVEQFGNVRHDGPDLGGERPDADPAVPTVGTLVAVGQRTCGPESSRP